MLNKENKDKLKRICNYLIFVFCNIVAFTFFHLIWVFVHFITSHLYVGYCTEKSMTGFLLSAVMSQAPHCTGIAWLFSISREYIRNMWYAVGNFVCIFITTNFVKLYGVDKISKNTLFSISPANTPNKTNDATKTPAKKQ